MSEFNSTTLRGMLAAMGRYAAMPAEVQEMFAGATWRPALQHEPRCPIARPRHRCRCREPWPKTRQAVRIPHLLRPVAIRGEGRIRAAVRAAEAGGPCILLTTSAREP